MKNYEFKIAFFLVIFFTVFSYTISAQDGQVTVNQSEEIDKLLELKKDINRTEKLYKIQIYSGNRSGAEKAKTDFLNSYSDWRVSMEYETPNYKIWVGNFKTRLEADRALLRVKKTFNNAFIFKPKKENKN